MSDTTLLTRPEVEELCKIARSTIYRGIHAGEFPPPVRVGKRAVRWLKSEIEIWIKARPHTTDDNNTKQRSRT